MNHPVDVEAHVQLQRAAREWQKLQVAALGFVGLCGMLRGDSVWPRDDGERSGGVRAQILVTTSSGSTCGTLLSSASGSIDLAVDGSRVKVPLNC
jgi:hypothetical protein